MIKFVLETIDFTARNVQIYQWKYFHVIIISLGLLGEGGNKKINSYLSLMCYDHLNTEEAWLFKFMSHWESSQDL